MGGRGSVDDVLRNPNAEYNMTIYLHSTMTIYHVVMVMVSHTRTCDCMKLYMKLWDTWCCMHSCKVGRYLILELPVTVRSTPTRSTDLPYYFVLSLVFFCTWPSLYMLEWFFLNIHKPAWCHTVLSIWSSSVVFTKWKKMNTQGIVAQLCTWRSRV